MAGTPVSDAVAPVGAGVATGARPLPPSQTARWRQRVRDWWSARIAVSDSLVLDQRNIYILPTRAGLMFGLTLLILLIASINYQLNLGYALTFLLAGSGVASMHTTHNTLRGLRLHLRPLQPAFAGEPVRIEIVLTGGDRERRGIGLRVADGPRGAVTWTDVAAGSQATAAVSFVPPRRGRHRVPMLMVETRFPLGLFRAWALYRPAATALAYPAPERPPAPLPGLQARGPADGGGRSARGDEIDGVRRYRSGDPMRAIVWRKFARSGELVSRDTGGSVPRELWLDYAETGRGDREARLARLTAWALEAQREGIDHGLRLPGVEIAPAAGEAHRRRCLEALALWE